ncbi:hypothetical protein [Aquitalea pelogenes]|uniref:hypothetical protein n=1 Tax=Aquitalea pelogenes TaxID=1293573 RepID=UPI0035AEE471
MKIIKCHEMLKEDKKITITIEIHPEHLEKYQDMMFSDKKEFYEKFNKEEKRIVNKWERYYGIQVSEVKYKNLP